MTSGKSSPERLPHFMTVSSSAIANALSWFRKYSALVNVDFMDVTEIINHDAGVVASLSWIVHRANVFHHLSRIM